MFMIEYLQNYGKYTTTGLTVEEKKELEQLRVEVKKYRDKEAQENPTKDPEVLSESSNNESDEGDEKADADFDKKLAKRQQDKKGMKRVGVSAEVYGDFNKKEDFVARVIPKTEEQINRIKPRILASFLFSALEQKDLEIVIGAMEEKTLKPGETIIQQGDKGDCLYIVENGELDCVKVFKQGEPETFLKKYVPGDSFGELALLYNAPRAATIRAKTDCVLWVLDRETFNNIVKDSAQKKREKYENFLKKVDILSTIDPYELMQVCDALKTASFTKGDYIIKEGELGDVFYILEEGECIATKVIEPGKAAQEIKRYKVGEYFGERALIKGEPRYANIEVTSELAKVISLDRASFKRLLGPIEPLLKRNIEKYKQFVKE